MADRSILPSMQGKTGTGQLPDPFCTGNPKVLAADVVGTLYVCGREW